MLVRTFNLRIDSETMQFDDSVLVQFSEEHEVLSWKTQFFYYQEEPIWSVMVSYRRPNKKITALQQSIPIQELRPKLKEPEREVSQADEEIYQRLRLWRNETAKAIGHPPSNLFTNRQIREIIAIRPTSIHDLTKVHGVGTYKSSTYGREILALLQEVKQKTTGQFEKGDEITSANDKKSTEMIFEPTENQSKPVENELQPVGVKPQEEEND